MFTKTLILKLRALIFAKEWDVTVGRTTVARKEKWMCHERSDRAAKYGKLEEALMLWFNDIRSREAPVTDTMLVDKAQYTTSTISRKRTDFFQK